MTDEFKNYKLICKVSEASSGIEYTAQVYLPQKDLLLGLFWHGSNLYSNTNDTVLMPLQKSSEYKGQTSVDIREIYNVFDAFLEQVRNDDVLFEDGIRI